MTTTEAWLGKQRVEDLWWEDQSLGTIQWLGKWLQYLQWVVSENTTVLP